MKKFVAYIVDYFKSIDKRILIIVTLFTAALVFINYRFNLDGAIRKINYYPVKLIAWFGVFLCAFGIPWLLQRKRISSPRFYLLLLLAPLLFAIKISTGFHFFFTPNTAENSYWNQVIYWPLLCLGILLLLRLTWQPADASGSFYGWTTRQLNAGPYLLLLLGMVPLVTLAATQPDFQAMYPKLQHVYAGVAIEDIPAWKKLLYELSYGTDFITIETFFRGFLVIGFAKWAGKEVVLPMACFYCTIHFGKPMGECISSYAGGMILGILVVNTRSIVGGLAVHLGIAWLMELAGYLAK